MPLLAIVIAFNFDWYLSGRLDSQQEYLIYLVIAISTMAFPAINILLLRWYGMVTSLEMPARKERVAPFLSTVFFFALGYYLLRKGTLPTTIFSIFLGCMATLVILSLINFKWKISAHSAGIGGVLGSTMALFSIHEFGNVWLATVLIICVGLTMTARLVLNAHSPSQVYGGAVLGFSITYLVVFYQWFI